ncbi:hypothetical protein GOV06_01765 [Candidatus Woesearchaeota archaeon]|nr:hypothetical protein [Candidatus Woesearchaeota archaeon]
MDTITETKEAEPASGSLDDILTDLKSLEKENSRVRVSLYNYDEQFVAIWLSYTDSNLKKRPIVAHLAFKVYSEDRVVDNNLVDEEHPECHKQIRDYMLAQGYDVPPLPEPVKEIVYKPEPQRKGWAAALLGFALSYL